MTAHTPGLWTRVLEGSGTNPNLGDWGVDSERGINICSYANKADAALIAAAPVLLDTLKTSERNLVSLRDAGLPGPLEEWLGIVRAAIAKATAS